MNSREIIQTKLDDLSREFGSWTYDIPLPDNIWTAGNLNLPHTRLKRIVQLVHDLSLRAISDCRVLDLGCLEGMFSIEFALRGARTVGIDVREANIKKANFCKEVLGLENLTFILGDARSLSLEKNGAFDVIICSGLLYHLTGEEVVSLIHRMFDCTRRMVIIDTHIALEPVENFIVEGIRYFGKTHREHEVNATPKQMADKLLASWENTSSFWFTRPSLLNLLQQTGFSSVYECFIPPHLNFGRPGLEHSDRCTFAAIKSEPQKLHTSPAANSLTELWPEKSLSYCLPEEPDRSLWQAKMKKKLKKLLRSTPRKQP